MATPSTAKPKLTVELVRMGLLDETYASHVRRILGVTGPYKDDLMRDVYPADEMKISYFALVQTAIEFRLYWDRYEMRRRLVVPMYLLVEQNSAPLYPQDLYAAPTTGHYVSRFSFDPPTETLVRLVSTITGITYPIDLAQLGKAQAIFGAEDIGVAIVTRLPTGQFSLNLTQDPPGSAFDRPDRMQIPGQSTEGYYRDPRNTPTRVSIALQSFMDNVWVLNPNTTIASSYLGVMRRRSAAGTDTFSPTGPYVAIMYWDNKQPKTLLDQSVNYLQEHRDRLPAGFETLLPDDIVKQLEPLRQRGITVIRSDIDNQCSRCIKEAKHQCRKCKAALYCSRECRTEDIGHKCQG